MENSNFDNQSETNFKYRSEMIHHLLNSNVVNIPTFYKKILYSILVENKSYADVAQINHIPKQKVRGIFLNSFNKLSEGISDLKVLLNNFKEISEKNENYETEATLYKKGLVTEKKFIESFGIEYTPEIAMALTTKILETNLDERIKNLCRANDIVTILDLITGGRKSLQMTRHCGKKTLIVLERFLESKGLTWLA